MISGYINSVPFSVYDCGEIEMNTTYYVRWLPSYISSGTFIIDGSTYNYSDYSSGIFDNFNTAITQSAFATNTTSISYIETDTFGIDSGAFSHYGCPLLSSVSIPYCKYIGYCAFLGCDLITSISLPQCESIGEYAFALTGLSKVCLPKINFISGYAFADCSNLKEIYLEADSVCELFSSTAFKRTGITSSTGYIIVPDSLYSSYIVASEWSYFYNRIFASTAFNTYIEWTPSGLSTGTFTIEGNTYNFSDYNGYFNGFNKITSSAFQSTGVVQIITNTTSIDESAFYSCRALESANLMSCEYIGTNAFHHCNLYRIKAPECKYIGDSAFQTNNLSYEAVLTKVEYIGDYAFRNTHIRSINLPECSYIGTLAFGAGSPGFTTLTSVSLPKCEYLGNNVFANQSNLNIIDLPVCSYIGNLYNKVYSLTLGSSSVCSTGSSSPLSWINNTRGYICVPPSLVSAYKTDSVWSNYSNRIFPIGGQSYYINWIPSNISSGTFKIVQWDYNFSDYSNGYFSMYDSIITSTAFANNHNIKSIHTNVKVLGCGAFISCTSLSYVNLPECEHISGEVQGGSSPVSGVFYNCTSLKEISLPKCKYVGTGAFKSCNSLEEISLPMCSFIGTWVFESCYNLQRAYLPSLSSIPYMCFYGCRSLSYVYAPECLGVEDQAFLGCKSLYHISLPKCYVIGSETFRGAGLQTITLANSSVCVLVSTSAFYSCPLSGIFVPLDLVNAYKISTNWSQFSLIIYPITS